MDEEDEDKLIFQRRYKIHNENNEKLVIKIFR